MIPAIWQPPTRTTHPSRWMTEPTWLGGLMVAFSLFLIGPGQASAQSSMRKMIEARSLPSRLSRQSIERTSLFGPDDLLRIDARSTMSAQQTARLGVRSENSEAEKRFISIRSNLSPAAEILLDKRSEPEAEFEKSVQRHSTPDSRMHTRSDLIDQVFLMAVQKRSNVGVQEKKTLSHLSGDPKTQSQIEHHSIDLSVYSRRLSKRSVPDPAVHRLLRTRSTDK